MLSTYDDSTLVPRWEKLFVLGALIILAGAVIPLLQAQHGTVDPVAGDWMFQLMAAIIYGTVGMLLLWRRGLSSIWKNKEILVLVLFVLVSVAWSAEPSITVRRSLALAGTSLFGVHLAFRFTFREQLRLVSLALGICAIASLLVVAVAPKFGLMGGGEYAGSWRGVFVHKNGLGESMALAASCFLLLLMGKQRVFLRLGGLALCLSLIAGSRSMTAVAVFLILALLIPVFRVLRWSRLKFRYSLLTPVLVVSALTIVLMGAWALLDFRNFLLTFGRDPTLSGRTYLWSTVLDMLHGHSWLGYGYGAFWIGEGGEEGIASPNPAHWSLGGGDDVSQILGWPVSHAHNGFLNLLLDLGAIGMVIFLIGYLFTIWRAIRWVRATKKLEDLWPLLYLAFLTLYNVTESSILKRNSIFWALYVAVAVSLVLRRSSSPAMDEFGSDKN